MKKYSFDDLSPAEKAEFTRLETINTDLLQALRAARLELIRLGMWGTVELYIDPAITRAEDD